MYGMKPVCIFESNLMDTFISLTYSTLICTLPVITWLLHVSHSA